jgi:hypothetical protein
MQQLNTHELRALMSDDPEFIGAFPSDCLPPLYALNNITKPVKLIVNLDPSSQPGSHWVAIYRRADGVAYYFDTFGRPPPPRIHSWLAKNCKDWKSFDKQIQGANDKVSCGYICLTFLKKLNHGK